MDTFEEEKAVETIRKTVRGLRLLEWNIRVFFDHQSHASMTGQSLSDTLELLLSDDSSLNRKALVLLGAHFFLDNPAVTERLKQIEKQINHGDMKKHMNHRQECIQRGTLRLQFC